ncbi:MAG: hypothetical protein ACE14L_09785 [Terriglobales bacterium]
MKVGAENKTKAISAIALLAIGIALGLNALRPTTRPSAPAANAAGAGSQKRPAKTQRTAGETTKYVAATLSPTLDPRLRLDLLKSSENVNYEGSGRNIFREGSEPIPTPKGPGLLDDKPQAPVWQPPVPPPPPPIDVKFFGWASRPGEPKAIFLSRGDSVFVAHEGDIVARRYRVVKINSNNVEIEDVLSNNRQSIPLTQG